MPQRACSWLLFLTMCAGAAHGAVGHTEAASETEEIDTVRGLPIQSGFVILDGQYLPPPYVVARRGDQVLLNEHVIPVELLAGPRRGPGMRGGPAFGMGPRQGPGMRGGPGFGMGPPRGLGMRGDGEFGRGPRRWRPGQGSGEAMLERRLRNDGLLLGLDSQTIGFVPTGQDIHVLKTLVSDATDEAKLRRLVESDFSWIGSAQWARFLDSFQPTEELAQRVRSLVAQQEREIELAKQHLSTVMRSSPSGWMRYGITIGAMLLGAVALGSLLSHRPPGSLRWREVDASGDGVSTVVRNVVLLVLLGLFDLTSTVMAEQSAGFLEMNPLGHLMIEGRASLVAFKIGTLLASAGILLALRRYRGAQLAAWWMCLICTVLTFRWAAFSSMFLT